MLTSRSILISNIGNWQVYLLSSGAQTIDSALDYETDSVIQKSLRNRVANGVTLLTVAHRLQTVMDYDRIVCPNCSLV